MLYNSIQFSLFLIVIILFEIGIGAFGYFRQDDLKAALDKGFNQTLKDYKANEQAWDLVQTEVRFTITFLIEILKFP